MYAYAQVVKLADTQDLGSCAVTGVQVRVLSWAKQNSLFLEGVFFCLKRNPRGKESVADHCVPQF